MSETRKVAPIWCPTSLVAAGSPTPTNPQRGPFRHKLAPQTARREIGAASSRVSRRGENACNGYANGSGIVSAGPNAAFVIFGVESIDNSGGSAPFAFDPTKLYVQQGVQNFVDPTLSLYADILGPFAAVPTTVAKGFDMKFSVSAQGALVVQTANADGSTEANQTSYFLKYNAAATDPTVTLTKSDASQTSWPNTQDCTTILLH
jgi:hypothetical protein